MASTFDFTVVLEPQAEGFSVSVPALPEGDSEAEALEMGAAAIRLCCWNIVAKTVFPF